MNRLRQIHVLLGLSREILRKEIDDLEFMFSPTSKDIRYLKNLEDINSSIEDVYDKVKELRRE